LAQAQSCGRAVSARRTYPRILPGMATAARLARAVLGAAAAAAVAGAPVEDAALTAQFEECLREHGKKYVGAEWRERLANFRESVRAIGEHATRPSSHRSESSCLRRSCSSEAAPQPPGRPERVRVLAAAARPAAGGGAEPGAGAAAGQPGDPPGRGCARPLGQRRRSAGQPGLAVEGQGEPPEAARRLRCVLDLRVCERAGQRVGDRL